MVDDTKTKRTSKKAELDRLLVDARNAASDASEAGLSPEGFRALLVAHECTLRSRLIVERMKEGFVTDAIVALVDQVDQQVQAIVDSWV